MLKHPDYYRIQYDHVSTAYDKRYLKEPRPLFKKKDNIYLEKLDGSQLKVSFKGGKIYLEANNSHLPEMDKRPQFYGAWSWAWENLEKIQNLKGFTVVGEWLRVQHNLPYDNLPDWFIGFDVYSHKRKRFLDYWPAMDFLRDIGFHTAPLLHEGPMKYDNLPTLVEKKKPTFLTTSNLIDTRFDLNEIFKIQHPWVKGKQTDRFEDGQIYMEGVVIRPPQGAKFQTRKKTTYWTNCAKFVTQEFLDEFSEESHWTGWGRRENKLARWYE